MEGTRIFDMLVGKEISPASDTRTTYEKPESVKLSERLFQHYQSTWRTHLLEMANDRNFMDGAQWRKRDVDILLARNQTPIVVNVIKQAVDQACGMLTANNPVFSTTGFEDSDVGLSTAVSYILSHIWDKSDGNAFARQAIKDYYSTSIGYLACYFDPQGMSGAGQIKIFSPDSLEVLIDPASTDIYARDAAHILLKTTMNAEQIQDMWPTLARQYLPVSTRSTHRADLVMGDQYGLENQADNQMPRDDYHIHYDVINRYSKIKEIRHRIVDQMTFLDYVIADGEPWEQFQQRRTFIRQDSQQTRYITNPAEVAEAEQLMEETNGVWHFIKNAETEQPELVPGPLSNDPNAIPESEVTLEPSTMGDFIERGILQHTIAIQDRIQQVLTVGGVEWYSGTLEISDYPIVPLYANFKRGPFNMSHIRGVRGYQEYINKLHSLIVAHASSSTNVKLLIPRSSQNIKELEERWAKAGTAVIEYDPELGVPIVAGPVPLPNELYTNIKDAMRYVQEYLGIYPLMQGDPQDAPDTFKGTVALEEFGQRRIQAMKRDIEGALSHFGKVILQMAQAYYTDYRVVRVLQPEKPEISIAFNTSKASPLLRHQDLAKYSYRIRNIASQDYDVVMMAGSSLPSNRWALMSAYVELYKLGIIDQEEVLKKTNVADMEGVLERTSVIKRQMQAIEQLSQQVKDLQGDLQTAQREVVHAKQMVEVKDFELMLEKQRVKIEASTEIYGALMQQQAQMANQRNRQNNNKRKAKS